MYKYSAMSRSRIYVFNACFALNCLLLLLVLAGDHVVIPTWLQPFGRMHPILLHLPITLLLLYITWLLFFAPRWGSSDELRPFADWLLLTAGLLTSLTSVAGIFLSREEGYDASLLEWHKWSGLIISWLTMAWFAFRDQLNRKKILRITTSVVALIAVLITGHGGAVITHGENFVWAPLEKDKVPQVPSLEEAEVFDDMVQPILAEKCMGCHNTKKAKGSLVLDGPAALQRGGKSGLLWDTLAPNDGLLMSRLYLPLSAKKHMPPAGKPQLTDEETNILRLWIAAGADFHKKAKDLPVTDTLRILANALFGEAAPDRYEFAAADESTIRKLNSNGRVVTPLAEGSPALQVEFFSRAQFTSGQLKELLPVKEQVVSLNLNKMPMKDDALPLIAQMKQLRKLNLGFTDLSGTSLAALTSLKELRELSLSGTAVRKNDLKQIAALPHLSSLYLWNTNLSAADIAALQKSLPDLRVEGGFLNDTARLQLPPPVLINEEQVISSPVRLRLRHFVQGATIRYTLDGTIPDSMHAPVYSDTVTIRRNVLLTARAFRDGWQASAPLQQYFFYSSHTPDSTVNLLPPDRDYKGRGAVTLTDLVKGEMENVRSGRWLGYRQNNLETLLLFDHSIAVSNVTISTVIDIESYIMPPVRIEVWGGNDRNRLILLQKHIPEQPVKTATKYLKTFELSFPSQQLKYLKIVAVPVPKLPSWHRGKGDRGWVMADEIGVN